MKRHPEQLLSRQGCFAESVRASWTRALSTAPIRPLKPSVTAWPKTELFLRYQQELPWEWIQNIIKISDSALWLMDRH